MCFLRNFYIYIYSDKSYLVYYEKEKHKDFIG